MIHARYTLLPGLLCLLFLASCREPRPVRVVLVTLDTLRYDSIVPDETPAGGAESPMPLLLERARDGALFERFYAATSVTQPSHASMFTALHPWEHGVVSNGQVLEERVDTVAEVLRAEGFATAAVVASFPVAARFGFAQGFDSFDDRFTGGRVPVRVWEGHPLPDVPFYSLADSVTHRALMHLGNPGRDPDTGRLRDQLLWVHYFDPHDPYGDTGEGPQYAPPRAYHAIEQGRDVAPLLLRFREAYDRDAAYLDRQLDRLLTAVEADAGRYESHVVLASDHGESFGEEGAMFHGMRLTDEQIRVPLVILSPRVAPERRRDVAGSVDVARTLLSLAGVAEPGEPWSRARDLVASRGNDTGLPAGALGMRRTFENPGRIEIRTDGTRHPLNELQFYAVDRDGRVFRGNGEGLDGAPPGADPGLERRLAGLFDAFEERLAAGPAPAELDPEAVRTLRALGYVQ